MHMSFEEPEEMDPVINPELKEKALKEMREWGTDLKEGATLEGLLESNIRGECFENTCTERNNVGGETQNYSSSFPSYRNQ